VGGECEPKWPTRYIYKKVDQGIPLIDQWNDSRKWMENALSEPENKVLVVSPEGIGRAAPLLIAYVLHKYNVSLQVALEHVLCKKEGTQLEPEGVVEDMKEFEKMQ